MPLVQLESGSMKEINTKDIYKDKTMIAFVIDGEVVDTFVCDYRLAAILQSNPEVVDISKRNVFFEGPFIGWKYDGQDFKKPSIDN